MNWDLASDRPQTCVLCTQTVGVIQSTAEANGMEVDGAGSGKRQLFVGQSAVNYRRENMEVRPCSSCRNAQACSKACVDCD